MNDPVESQPEGLAAGRRWLLLFHQLPPKPDYLRVKTRRRLRRVGAVLLKQTVYGLPSSDEALEDFEWIRREIEADGGSAVIVEAQFVSGMSDEELEAMLNAERAGKLPASESARGVDRVSPGTRWVTREDVHIDRMASAWLIRRFIDPEARFKFVPARGYRPRPAEVRFDMYEAEYTHVGGQCSFQVLVERFGLRDRALRTIGEIVHDIDCKDDRFDRPETAGVASLIRGIVAAHEDDRARIERGAAVFDDLYSGLRKQRS